MVDQISPLLLSIQLETARLTQQVAGVQGQLKSIGTTAQKSATGFDGFGAAVKGLTGKVVGLAAAYVSLATLQESMKMAAEARKAMALFESQLERSTGATRSQITSINDQIKALSTLSAVSSGTIRTSFEKLVTVTGDLTQSMELQTLAMDVAAGTGKPLAMVTMTLGRAATGTLTSLNRLVPGITAVKDPMGKLAATFKGAAEEAGNNDPYARMELRMNSLKKAIGDRLLVVIDALDKALEAAGPTFKEFAIPIGQATKALMPFAKAIGSALLDALKKLMPSFQKFVREVIPYATRLLNRLTPILIDVINALIDMAIYLEPVIELLAEFALTITDLVLKALEDLFGDLHQINEELAPLREFIDTYSHALDIATGKVKPEVDVTGVRDATNAYVAMTEAQRKAARFGLIRPPKPTDGGGAGSGVDSPQARARAAIKAIMVAEKEYRKAVKQLTKDFNAEMAQLTADHQKNIADIMRNGVQTLTDIVKSSQNRLRDAFKNVTQIDAGNMFINAGASITNFVTMLKDKLTASKRLAQDAANLAAAGYSQTFIEQIIAQGPDIGSELSKQLLAATPEQAAQIQSLFGQVEDTSLHGVDELAQRITEQQGLATEELRDAYITAQAELTSALMAENEIYATAMIDLNTRFEDSMAALAKTRDKAIKNSLKELNDALGTNAKNLNAAMRVAEREMGDSAERMITRLRTVTDSTALVEQNAVIATPSTLPTTYVSPTGVSPSAASYGAPINISISVSTNASAEDIAAAVSNAIKYNLPYTVAGTV